MKISFKGKTVLITGGSSGIGASMVSHFNAAGANVCNFDLSRGSNEVDYFQVDIGIQSQVIHAISKVIEKYGQIHILINNAGIAHIGNLEETSEEALDKIYNVNIKGVYNGMFGVIPYMKKQKQGVIINMASIAASIGLPNRFAYSMSKSAVENMTYTVARDYIEDGIRCNCISPGRVHTPFVDQFIAKNYPGREKEMFEQLSKTQPIGRMGLAEEIAKMAMYLCSDEAAFITGSNFPIDGGFIKLNT